MNENINKVLIYSNSTWLLAPPSITKGKTNYFINISDSNLNSLLFLYTWLQVGAESFNRQYYNIKIHFRHLFNISIDSQSNDSRKHFKSAWYSGTGLIDADFKALFSFMWKFKKNELHVYFARSVTYIFFLSMLHD